MEFKKTLTPIVTLLLFTVIMYSCGAGNGAEESKETEASSYTSNETSATSEIKVIGPDNVAIASISRQGDNFRIFNGDVLITAKKGSSGKFKYMGASENVLAKINRYDYGFKLKSLEGAVLWKVKVSEDQIKLADNDQMENAYKIKQKSKVKIYRNEEEVGSVKNEAAFSSISGVNGTDFKVTDATALHAAIIGLEDVPMDMRLIILAELLR